MKGYGSERGATVVEFAVIVVLLLVIVFGILELAFIFYQRHFVENAAREGMRVGIRANNFNCFEGCDEARRTTAEQRVNEYLSNLYQPGDILSVEAERDPDNPRITVAAEVTNFFPRLLSGLIPGFANQTIISYSITGEYEDPAEYDNEE